jgi:peptidoglycan/xylan/chitin deacetylase (PgdA/CDA1 family)
VILSLPSAWARARTAVARRLTWRGLILTYHRVTEYGSDPWRLCVTPANFDAHLAALRAAGATIYPLPELVRLRRAGRVPRGAVAITFDDGYQDNLEHARPILERFEAPATMFITAGYVGHDGEFWWDVLERIFLLPGTLPDMLKLELGGEEHCWRLGADANLSDDGSNAWPQWKPLREGAPTVRHRVFNELWFLLVGAMPDERLRAVTELIRWASVDPNARATHRPLSERELRALATDELVTIGAHSLTHPALSALPVEVQEQELTGAKARLETLLGKPVTAFSYPQGRASPTLQHRVEQSGYDFACGSRSDALTNRSEVYHLPRVSVRDWDAPRFGAFLKRRLPSGLN